MKTEIADLKAKQLESDQEKVLLRNEIDYLKDEVLQLQQYSRRKNIEISELPELEGEDVNKTVCDIFKVFDREFDTDGISIAHRVPSARKDKPKAIIVQFKTKQQRDKCLRLAKEKRLLSSDISSRFPGSPLYINEHLAPAMKKLFFNCRVFKREKDFKYCWVKEGKIYLRKTDNARVFRVTSIRDLVNIDA